MKLCDLNPGDKIIPDNGFTCIQGGISLVVQEDDHGKFVPCAEGKHYLDGQEDEDGELVGIAAPTNA